MIQVGSGLGKLFVQCRGGGATQVVLQDVQLRDHRGHLECQADKLII